MLLLTVALWALQIFWPTWLVEAEPVSRDLAEVHEEGVLRVGLAPEETMWFLDRGEPRGFEVELLGRAARELQVRLEVRGLQPEDDACAWLQQGVIDVLSERAQPLAEPCEGLTVAVPLAPFAHGGAPLVVRPTSPELAEVLGTWVRDHDRLRRVLAHRYFTPVRGPSSAPRSSGAPAAVGLSRYDDLFREGASALGWDWRLFAAQAYQESQFRPEAVSRSGAQGLMQLMPGTADMLGVAEPHDPDENVRGAVAYLEHLHQRWEGKVNQADLLAFVLASYNGGPGHVEDAVRMAAAQGDDPRSWASVRPWLLRKADPAWVINPVVHHGRADGPQAVAYVDAILGRYEHYRQLVPDC